MSCVVKTFTPFINKEILCAALEECGCRCTIQGDKIITDIKDSVLGFQTFEKGRNGKYILHAYSYYERKRIGFVKEVETHYNHIYQKHLEEIERARQLALAEIERKRNEQEKIRLEEERKREIARQLAIAEAERKRLEEEKIRLENERKAFVEKQKNAIIEKAESKGYYVKEEKVKDKIKLVLVKRTY